MTGNDSDSLRLVRRTTVAGMEPESPPTGALAPFRSRVFLWLWLGVVISSIGSWSQTVGAQWLFINDPNAATIVSLVQTASALPMVLLALVGGVLSDAFDRRRLMIWVQVYFVVVASMLSLLSSMHLVPPLLLLAFTFAIGVGNAIQLPTWQPLITELVPRSQIAAATRLDMVSVNVARAVGPAIAGLVIAAFGVPPVFAFNAACTLFLILALLAWRREPKIEVRARERFLPALRAGGRYVLHEPVVRLILVRLAMFIAPATAMTRTAPGSNTWQITLGIPDGTPIQYKYTRGTYDYVEEWGSINGFTNRVATVAASSPTDLTRLFDDTSDTTTDDNHKAVQNWRDAIVTGTSPAGGSSGAAPAAITVTFNWDVKSDGTDFTTAIAVAKGGSAVTGTITHDAGARSLTFTPSAPFTAGTYTVTVDHVVSLTVQNDGVKIRTPYMLSFTVN